MKSLARFDIGHVWPELLALGERFSPWEIIAAVCQLGAEQGYRMQVCHMHCEAPGYAKHADDYFFDETHGVSADREAVAQRLRECVSEFIPTDHDPKTFIIHETAVRYENLPADFKGHDTLLRTLAQKCMARELSRLELSDATQHRFDQIQEVRRL